jgi:hypothetical protein
VEVVAPLVALGVLGSLVLIRDLNIVALGEERAAELGVDVDGFKWRAVALGALLAGAAVSVSGVIGFVGLMTPHLLRLVVGADHRGCSRCCSPGRCSWCSRPRGGDRAEAAARAVGTRRRPVLPLLLRRERRSRAPA